MAITNLTGTKWVFNETPSTQYISGNIHFNCNLSVATTYQKISILGSGANIIQYVSEDYQNSNPYTVYTYTGGWVDNNARTIEITGGDDVENADLIAFLQSNATLIPQNFKETKTALKIYEDLSQAEYEGLEKDSNTFYLVNGVGVYKGKKLIASAEGGLSEEEVIALIENETSTLATKTEVEAKQDVLTAGENITIVDNVISVTGVKNPYVSSNLFSQTVDFRMIEDNSSIVCEDEKKYLFSFTEDNTSHVIDFSNVVTGIATIGSSANCSIKIIAKLLIVCVDLTNLNKNGVQVTSAYKNSNMYLSVSGNFTWLVTTINGVTFVSYSEDL